MPVGEYKRFKKDYKCSKCGSLVEYHPVKLLEMWYSKRNEYRQEDKYCLCEDCYDEFERWIKNDK